MINIISYIGKLLPKEVKGRTGLTANNLIKGSIECRREIINARDSNLAGRKYGKANLWIAFNGYDLDAVQSDKTSGRYSLKAVIWQLWGGNS